jgi:acetyl esterase/lipase
LKRLRILCLHGYHGNAKVLREQMSSLTRGLDHLAEFVYVDAPSLAQGDFGWWHAIRNESSAQAGDPGVVTLAARYKGWSRTRDCLVSLFDSDGPFDGVFGFSQGAALAALLVGLRSPDRKPVAHKPLIFNFVIVAGAFLANDPALANLYRVPASYHLPSVHIIGKSDLIVPSDYSREVSRLFKDPLVLEHGGGHIVAGNPEIREQVAAFLETQTGRSAAIAAVPVSATVSRPTEVPLWPGRAHPSMRLVFPKTVSAQPVPAMLIFRGGGYAYPSGSGGGSAEWAAGHGMVGIEVEYGTRSTQEFFPANFADAARSVRLVREKAREWNVDPKRVGVMGYSAGGHLASLVSTQPDVWKDPADNLAGQISARPDLVVLAYPVISFVEGYAPGALAGSAENFFGSNQLSESRRREFSNELHVDGSHPPVFVWTTRDDGIVPYTHAKLFADACGRANVPVVFKLYAHGPHGMGLARDQRGEVSRWPDELLDWLSRQGFMSSDEKPN